MAAIPSGAALSSAENVGTDGVAKSDGDKVVPAHAVIMLATFTVMFSLEAVLLRFLNSVKIHGVVQSVGVLAAIVGVGLGIYLSGISYSPTYGHLYPASHHTFSVTTALNFTRPSPSIEPTYIAYAIVYTTPGHGEWKILSQMGGGHSAHEAMEALYFDLQQTLGVQMKGMMASDTWNTEAAEMREEVGEKVWERQWVKDEREQLAKLALEDSTASK
ncbi:hypothetical protein G6011_09901 [Alternaria panax]|uniref:Uncharacterized protein n=1 Tax=Alternaria panax TaxID=48097 RepID=A0AAD4I5T6_9PLEO|nr:hypothetical protein G6011_09901 [Alternaria panax]